MCCKVQGIRNELFANDSYAAVSVDDIKQQFPAHTDLQLFWPSRSLLDVQLSSSATQTMGSWVQRPSGNPPPLPAPATTHSVIQKNPVTAKQQPSISATSSSTPSVTSALLHASSVNPSRSTVPTCTSSTLYNSWSSLTLQQVDRKRFSFV